MVEPIQLFQDSFGTLLWNKVAAAWQNNALHIGSYHRYKLPNARSQSLFTADGHDGQLDLALCELYRAKISFGRNYRVRGSFEGGVRLGTEVFGACG